MSKAVFSLSNTSGQTYGAWSDKFEFLREAGYALQVLMGWQGIVLSDSFEEETDEGSITVWAAYPDELSRDADDGSYAPRIQKRAG